VNVIDKKPEINKVSELMKSFLLYVEKKMQRENRDVRVYDIWDKVIKKENISFGASLEDVKGSSLIVHVRHSGVAQQIRLKSRKLLSAFNEEVPDLKIKKISIFIEQDMNFE